MGKCDRGNLKGRRYGPLRPPLINVTTPVCQRYATNPRIMRNFMTIATASSTDKSLVSILRSGASGTSYGSSIPVKPRMFPLRAAANRPFGSRDSHTSIGVDTCTSMNPPTCSITSRAEFRAAAYGAIRAQRAIPLFRVISRARPATRLTCRLRSSLENPKSLEICRRSSSPSRTVTLCPSRRSSASSPRASVVLPAPGRPVSNIEIPEIDTIGQNVCRTLRDICRDSLRCVMNGIRQPINYF